MLRSSRTSVVLLLTPFEQYHLRLALSRCDFRIKYFKTSIHLAMSASRTLEERNDPALQSPQPLIKLTNVMPPTASVNAPPRQGDIISGTLEDDILSYPRAAQQMSLTSEMMILQRFRGLAAQN